VYRLKKVMKAKLQSAATETLSHLEELTIKCKSKLPVIIKAYGIFKYYLATFIENDTNSPSSLLNRNLLDRYLNLPLSLCVIMPTKDTKYECK